MLIGIKKFEDYEILASHVMSTELLLSKCLSRKVHHINDVIENRIVIITQLCFYGYCLIYVQFKCQQYEPISMTDLMPY